VRKERNVLLVCDLVVPDNWICLDCARSGTKLIDAYRRVHGIVPASAHLSSVLYPSDSDQRTLFKQSGSHSFVIEVGESEYEGKLGLVV
jgi:hypothetical protein